MFRFLNLNPRHLRLLPLALVAFTPVPLLMPRPSALRMPAIIVVSQSGGPFFTITAGVAAASDGDVIQVHSGTYVEHSINLGSKNLNLVSVDGPNTAIIDGTSLGGTGNSIFIITHGQNPTTVIDGFKMMKGSSDYGGAILCRGTSPLIKNNTFENNLAGSGGAIYADAAAPTIDTNTFTGNGYDSSTGNLSVEGGAIELSNCTSLVQNNTFTANRAGAQGGALSAVINSNLTVQANTFDDNIVSGLSGSSLGNGGAMAVTLGAFVNATDNHFTNNSAVYNGGAVWLSGQTLLGTSVFNNNTFESNAAVNNNGGGVYCDNTNCQFIGSQFNGNSAGFEGGIGGGACCSGAGTSSFQSCRFINNLANIHGGGIACAFDATVKVSRSSIVNNNTTDLYLGTGAGVYVESASVTLRRNLISGNGLGNSSGGQLCHRGGGIDYAGGTGTPSNGILEGNTITGNGIHVTNGGQIGEGAGVAMRNMGPGSSFISNVVAHNSSPVGGGFKCAGVLIQNGSSFRFGNNTIAFNSNPGGTGGGVMFENVANQFTLVNCIIWGNVALSNSTNDPVVQTTPVPTNPTPLLHHCDVSASGPTYTLAWTPVSNMFNTDPLFANNATDLHLRLVSPVIDMGDNTVIVSGDVDIDGQARINPAGAAIVDIGADET